MRLWRGLYLGTYSEDDVDRLRRDPSGFLREVGLKSSGVGIHWTDDPTSAWNFSQDRDPDGNPIDMDEYLDQEEGVRYFSVGLVLEAEVEDGSVLVPGTDEYDDYAMSDAILDYSIERERTLRDGSRVSITGGEFTVTDDQGGEFSISVPLNMSATASASDVYGIETAWVWGKEEEEPYYGEIYELGELQDLFRKVLEAEGIPYADEAAVQWSDDPYKSHSGYYLDAGCKIPLALLGSEMANPVTVIHEAAHFVVGSVNPWVRPEGADLIRAIDSSHDSRFRYTFARLLRQWYPEAEALALRLSASSVAQNLVNRLTEGSAENVKLLWGDDPQDDIAVELDLNNAPSMAVIEQARQIVQADAARYLADAPPVLTVYRAGPFRGSWTSVTRRRSTAETHAGFAGNGAVDTYTVPKDRVLAAMMAYPRSYAEDELVVMAFDLTPARTARLYHTAGMVDLDLPEGVGAWIVDHDDEWTQTPYVSIDKINVREELRRQGLGTKAMQIICDWADAHDKVLSLTPANDFGTPLTVLNRWYRGFGFVKNKDYEIGDDLVRYPNGQTRNQYLQSLGSVSNFGDWESHGLDGWYTDPGPLTVYHGTTADRVEGIQRDGLTPPPGINPAMWFMVTTDRGQAARYASGDHPVVLEYRIPADQVTTYLWPPHAHDVYGFDAWAMGVRKPLPSSMLASAKTASVDDYGGQHQPPAPGDDVGACITNMEQCFPADVYDHPEWYSSSGRFPEIKAILNRSRNNPSAMIDIYRAVPPGVSSIDRGNWVAIIEDYARGHAMQSDDPSEDWPVLKATVPASTIWTGGDDLNEWGYWGPDITNARTASKTALRGPYYHATPSDNVQGILATGLKPHGANSQRWGDFIEVDDAVYLADSIVDAENWGSEVAQAVVRADDPDYDPDAEAETYEPGPFDDEPWLPSHFYVEIAILEVRVPDDVKVETHYHTDGKEVIAYGSIPPANIRLVKTFTMADEPERFGFYMEASRTASSSDPEHIGELKKYDLKRQLSDREVEAKARKVIDAVAARMGVDLSDVEIVWDEYLEGDARFSDANSGWKSGRVIRLNPNTVLADLKDPDYGVHGFRQISHETMHACSGTSWVYEGRIEHDIEEGGAEILSVCHWDQHGQPYDKRDAYREPGEGWVDGVRALVHHSVYKSKVDAVIRRAASKVGWNAPAILREVERVFKGDDGIRWRWGEETDPSFPLPAGSYGEDAALMWLVTNLGHRTAKVASGPWWYHAGMASPDSWVPGRYAHVGNEAAAREFTTYDDERTVWRMHLTPRRPLRVQVSDPEANTLQWWFERGRNQHVDPHGLIYDYLNSGNPVDVGALIDRTGWTPETDVVYYENWMEGGSALSAMVLPSAVSDVQMVDAGLGYEPGHASEPRSWVWAAKTASSSTIYRGLRLASNLSFDEFYLALARGDLDAAADYLIEVAEEGDGGSGGMGMHWTTDLATAKRFAAASSEPTVSIDPSNAYVILPVVFEATYQSDDVETNEDALWAGGVEGHGSVVTNPEFEVPIRSGSGLTVAAVHMAVPEDREMVQAMFSEDWASSAMSLPYQWVRHQVSARSVVAKTASSDGDDWKVCADGEERWGLYGAAGCLFFYVDDHGTRHYFLQLRAGGVDESGTWGIPGGAISEGEDPVQGALREFAEEVGFIPEHTIVRTYVDQVAEDWAYTTVIAQVHKTFDHDGSTWEASHGAWFTASEMRSINLHPAFAEAFPRVASHADPSKSLDNRTETGLQTTGSSTYYHGTNQALSPGDALRPGSLSGVGGDWESEFYDSGYIYFTTNLAAAERFAWIAVQKRGGDAHIYEVSPGTSVIPDPESESSMGGFAEGSYMSLSARVKREVPLSEWPGIIHYDPERGAIMRGPKTASSRDSVDYADGGKVYVVEEVLSRHGLTGGLIAEEGALVLRGQVASFLGEGWVPPLKYVPQSSMDTWYGGARGCTTESGSVIINADVGPTRLDVLHELAHVYCGAPGHGPVWCDMVARLYGHFLSPGAEALFRDFMGMDKTSSSADWGDPFYNRVDELKAAGVTEGQPLYRGIPLRKEVRTVADALAACGEKVGQHWTTDLEVAKGFTRWGMYPAASVILETQGWSWLDVVNDAGATGRYVHEKEVPFDSYFDVPIYAVWLCEKSTLEWVRHEFPHPKWVMASKTAATFQPQLKLRPEEIQEKVLDDAEYALKARGHDVKPWTTYYKGSTKEGWITECVRCGKKYETAAMPYYKSDPDSDSPYRTVRVDGPNPTLKEMGRGRTVTMCNPQPTTLWRGIRVHQDPDHPDVNAILAEITSRPLGRSWSYRKEVAQGYAKSRINNLSVSGPGPFEYDPDGKFEWLPVVVTGEFWRMDQPRNYKPKGFVTLPEYEGESERFLANHEKIRIVQIEVWDHNTNQWVAHSVPSLVAKTSSVADDLHVTWGVDGNGIAHLFRGTNIALCGHFVQRAPLVTEGVPCEACMTIATEEALAKTSAWDDVRSKAKRIRSGGGVHVIAVADNGAVTAEVQGDHGVYQTTVWLTPRSRQLALWDCTCPWDTYAWARSGPWERLEGRPCAHALAVYYQIQSDKMFGGEVKPSKTEPSWSQSDVIPKPDRQMPRKWRVGARSWRAMGEDSFWDDYPAVIVSEGGGSGRRSYEVYDHGALVATRDTLVEAKEVVSGRWGREVSWKTKRLDPMTTDHYYFGPVDWFGEPTTIWAGA